MTAVSGVANCYKILSRPRPRTIVVAGLGRGEEMPVFRRCFRRARIIGVEPLHEHWRIVRRAGDRMPDVVVKRALWSTVGARLTFHLNYEPDQRATVYELPRPVPGEETREIETTTLDALFREYGPWRDGLLWLDCEGAEQEILAASTSLARAYRWINVELTFCPARNVPPWQETDEVLRAAGFRLLAVHSAARNGRQTDGIYVRAAEWDKIRILSVESGIQRKLDRLAERSRRILRRRGER